jgi:hypothetical protein
MCMSTIQAPLADLHTRFQTFLPKIETHGRIYFRHLKGHKKEEVLQEMRALAWLWFVRLARRGKDAADFLVTFTRFLARAVSSGRRIIGQEKAKDPMSPLTQKRHGFTVESLPSSDRVSFADLYSTVGGQREHDAMEERLQDNTATPVPEQAAFRIDWPAWMKTRTQRDRRIIKDLMAGERTFDVSRKFGMSPARVSQLRSEFRDDWESFCALPETEEQIAA